MSGLPQLDLSKVETSGRKPRGNGFVGSLTSASARTAEPPRDTLMSSNSYLATARELVFTYKERNGPGMGGLGETKQRHRLRGFHTEDMGLKRVDFKADKALLALPEYQHMKQEGINAVTSPRPGQPADGSFKRKGVSAQRQIQPSTKSHSYGGHLDLSHKKLGDDYTYAAIKALGTTVHRTDIDYLTRKELESAYHTISEGEESDSDDEKGDEIVKSRRVKRRSRRKNAAAGMSEKSGESKHHRITHINLQDNRLSDAGLVRVVDCICEDSAIIPFIRSMDLSENALRKKGADAIAKLLRCADDLAALSLEKMQFNDTTVKCLCRGLRGESALTSLNLSGNAISNAGAIALARVLAGTTNRRHPIRSAAHAARRLAGDSGGHH